MSAIDIDGVLFLQGFAVYDVPNYRRIVPATYSAALVGDVIPAPDLSPGGLSDAHAAEQRSILARFPGMMG